ncbi:RNA polymerase sigma factor [Bdellovibrio sp. ZAP7]|uniref:RNA polymerase sigma factor n=1 Tax=Bdellovibrio sp. ZAP7 TaxID=2231053 RepID=UPI001FEF0A25|nr:sigma-70 family RNA polymerase sigma factor [Bdellovibrio sp. ZAP7]
MIEKKLEDQTDEELLISLAEGETKALDYLYTRHSGRVLSYIKKRGLSAERADDVLQIVFMQIFRKKHLYDPKHQALAWIYVITRSELKDYRNREIKNHLEWDDKMSQSDESAPSVEHEEEAAVLLKELGPREQEALRLRYLDELEYEEMARRMKTSNSNIRQLVSRALKALRRNNNERH